MVRWDLWNILYLWEVQLLLQQRSAFCDIYTTEFPQIYKKQSVCLFKKKYM